MKTKQTKNKNNLQPYDPVNNSVSPDDTCLKKETAVVNLL